jgi:LDH2 family malate/lactate/ureidoglycolate dehydrogenase
LKSIYYDRIVHHKIQKPVTELEVVRDFAAVAAVDGHHGMGMVIAKRCMEMAIEKAEKFGIGMVTATNSTHYGIAAYYPLMAAARDMVGMTGTNARPSVAPTFGVDNLLGTNPLVFAVPTDEGFPFTNDYATSIIQRGAVEKAVREGTKIPEGLVISRNGKSVTDPGEILEGLISGDVSLLPIGGSGEETGGYKGYGFSTVVELLSAAFQQGAFLRQLSGFSGDGSRVPYALGHFFIAVNIKAFTDPAEFRKTAGGILRTLRNSQKMPCAEKIYTCGEKEHMYEKENTDKGIAVNPALQKQILTMRDELNLDYDFGF